MARRGKGEGSIRQRPDGRWEARLTVDAAGGQRVRRSFFGQTRAEARDKLLDAAGRAADNLPIPSGRETVEHFLKGWVDRLQTSDMRPRTWASYSMIVTKHLIPAIGNRTLTKLSAEDIGRYMSDKRKSGLSPRTVQYHHAVLRAALGEAEDFDKVPRNVAKRVSPPKVEHTKIRPLTPEQAVKFIDAIGEHRDVAIYLLALRCGLRLGEVLGLQWSDIDFEAKTLTVSHTLQRYDRAYHLDLPKTEESARTIGVGAAIIGLLAVHGARQAEERKLAKDAWVGDDLGDLVFRTERGEPRNGSAVTHQFQAILDKLELPRQRFHDLRHGAATFMLAQGIDLKIIQEVLGHSTYKLTADTYIHVRTEATRLATSAVDALLSANRGQVRGQEPAGGLASGDNRI